MSVVEARNKPAAAVLLAGVPLAKWAFALRIWLAMMVALYCAFWLQLDSASSSAVTVAILALPRRGQAFQKALYRFGATIVGVIASIVITAVFTQSRDLFIVAFAAWMALAVYVATCYDGTRAYGAVLSGYTVAIVAVMQIDSPQNVFMAGLSRFAVVSLGIASLALINDVFAAPEVYPEVRQRLLAAHDATCELIRSLLRGEDPGPDRTVQVLGQITGCRLDILALSSENPKGTPRCEAAKSAAAAMVGSISAARAYAMLSRRLPHEPGLPPVEAIEDCDPKPIEAALDVEMAKNEPSPDRVLALHCALYLAERRRLAAEELAAMQRADWPQRGLDLPIHHDRELARRSAARVFIAICVSAVLFIQSSWPMTSVSFSLIGVLAGLSSTTPDPKVFAKGALIAMPLAVVIAGITEFLILDGTDQFPLLALGMAPAIFFACFLILHPKLGGLGLLLLVFTPVIFPPSNPQSYNPQAYVLTGCLATAAVMVFAMLLIFILPTTDRDRRRWMVNAARRDLLNVVSGRRRLSAPEATYLTADRIVALARFKIGGPGGRRWRLRYTLLLSNLTNAAVRGLDALDALARDKICTPEVRRARDAFCGLVPTALRDAAIGVARSPLPDDIVVRRHAASAIANLQFAALLAEADASTIRHLRQAFAA